MCAGAPRIHISFHKQHEAIPFSSIQMNEMEDERRKKGFKVILYGKIKLMSIESVLKRKRLKQYTDVKIDD